MTLAALITTYNEADTIDKLVRDLRPLVDRILVVDDRRSTDDTELRAFQAGAHTLVPRESGIGPCLLAGMAELRGYRVVVLDAGGSHSPSAIPRMVQIGADVVIGSRFLPGSGYVGRKRRKMLSKTYAKACNLAAGYEITDWTSGFRVYSPAAIAAILARPPSARMHGFQPEALATCLAEGLTVAETPITYKAGRTSMDHRVATEAVLALGRLSCL